jgi:hypothetical protein
MITSDQIEAWIDEIAQRRIRAGDPPRHHRAPAGWTAGTKNC